MVLNDDCWSAGPRKPFTKLISYSWPPKRGRHPAVLVGVDLVLRSDRADLHALVAIPFEELHEILRVRPKIVIPHRAAEKGFVRLHPAGRAPRRGKQEEIGIGLLSGTQHWQDVSLVMIDTEMGEVGIWLRGVIEAVCAERIVAGAHACAADRHSEAVTADEIVEELLATRGIHAAEEIAGGISEGSAKTENALKAQGGVNFDYWPEGRGRRLPGRNRGFAEAVFSCRDPCTQSRYGACGKTPQMVDRQCNGSRGDRGLFQERAAVF